MMNRLEALPAIHEVPGFQLGTAHAGLKKERPDLMVLRNDGPAPSAAAVFTQNTFAAAPIHVSRQHLARGDIRALVVNAGLANACTGRQGLRDALTMARETADALGLEPEQVLVASTGIIGRRLPMDKIHRGIWEAADDLGHGADAPRAILTTDSGPKMTERTVDLGDRTVTMRGFAKGSGMIHPNMATMLAFVLTDAPVEQRFLQECLREATGHSFNQISVDADPSTNDMAAVFASGAAGGPPIEAGTPAAAAFKEALAATCTELAMQIAGDGEGASRLIEAHVTGAADTKDAQIASRAVVSSFLVKAAVHGADANWGRVLGAIGSTHVLVDPEAVTMMVASDHGECTVLSSGSPTQDDPSPIMDAPVVRLQVDLNAGTSSASAWGCDVSPESVSFNAEKTT